MVVTIPVIQAALREMGIIIPSKSGQKNRKFFKNTFLDRADEIIAAAGGARFATTALTSSQVALYNTLVSETDEQSDALDHSESSAKGARAAGKGKGGVGDADGKSGSKKGIFGVIQPRGGSHKKSMSRKASKPPIPKRGVPVVSVAVPLNVRPREVRKNYTRVTSIMDTYKQGGGTYDEIVRLSNQKYVQNGGRYNLKETRFYLRIVNLTLQHLGLLLIGEDGVMVIRQER